MGAIRTFPENHTNPFTEKYNDLYYATVSCCGWQHFMQAYQVSITQGPFKLFAIFDGHGGPQCAQFCQKHISELAKSNKLIQDGQTGLGIQNMLAELEHKLSRSHEQINSIRELHSLPILPAQQYTKAGCSLVLALITDDQIVIAIVGQCKCYVTYKNDKSKSIQLSGNHTTANQQEHNRIVKNGGYVLSNGLVNGTYSYTRSLGDFHLKALSKQKQNDHQSIISSQPSVFPLSKQDIDRVVIGSKGSWEKPNIVLRTMMAIGGQAEEDRDCLDKLVGDLVAEDPSKGEGIDNIMLTCLCFE